MSHKSNLGDSFLAEKYVLSLSGAICSLSILGRKMPPPSQRIALNSKKINVHAAKISSDSKRRPGEIIIKRLNYLPKLAQLRIHTESVLYPGPYTIYIEFEMSAATAKQIFELAKINSWQPAPLRELFPSIDEPDARGAASFEINYSDAQDQI